MKRKQLASLYIAVLCMTAILTILAPKWENAQASQEAAVIPDEAIRLRILANSDSRQDQQIKRAIRDEVNVHITEWVQDLTSIEAAREVIQGHLPDIRRIAEDYVKEQGVAQQVEVEFGKANFPTKLYGEYIYPAGEYEAIVITLGSGQGANWWCVLFPPLCFLDFSNGTAVSMSPMEEEAGQGQGEASAKDMKEQEQRKASTEEKDEQGQEEA
ncbi:MAG: stage II sporulation protein R, partial [Bacillus sp. (in: firmicutes)]